MVTVEEDRFAYDVPQTPRDSSRRNSFFRRSSPVISNRLISTLHDGFSSIIGRGPDAEQPLQHRVTTLEDTLLSVHTTVNTLEHTLGEIFTLLRATPLPPIATVPSVPVPTFAPKSIPVTSPRVSAITQDRSPNSPATPSYRDTTRQKIPPAVPSITPVSAPLRDLRPNGSTSFPSDLNEWTKSPAWFRDIGVVKTTSQAITGMVANSTYTTERVIPVSKSPSSITT
jgi:hypothetical protein